jgi:dTDP-4-amino-4,6-dideoxygalactose transaminase
MKVPLVDIKKQYLNIKDEIWNEINEVFETTSFINGFKTKEFEKEFGNYLSTEQNRISTIGCGNGTDALILALKALKVGYNDEVLVPSHTFFATVEAILLLGAIPKFIDIDEESMLINPKLIEKSITTKTKALIIVHLYGRPCNMDLILPITKKFNLRLIEDCAQAQGAKWKNKYVGSFGDIGCFSFFPGKNLGAYGDAGLVASSNIELIKEIRLLANHGRKEKFLHNFIGQNSRLDSIQAAVLNVKLRYLDFWNSRRCWAASFYRKLLKDLDVKLPNFSSDCEHVWHQFVIRLNNRDEIYTVMNKKGINVGIHYPIPCHLQPALKFLNYKKGDFPVTEKVCSEILSMPICPEITEEKIHFVVANLNKLMSRCIFT